VDIYFLNEKGITQRQLAIRLDCAKTTIFRAIRRGKDLFEQWNAPRLKTYMGGIGSPTPRCDHPKIEVGDDYVCVVCCVSGYDTTDSMRVTTQDINKINGIPEPPKEEPKDDRTYAQKKFGGRGQTKGKKRVPMPLKLKQATTSAIEADIIAHLGAVPTQLTGFDWGPIIQALIAALPAILAALAAAGFLTPSHAQIWAQFIQMIAAGTIPNPFPAPTPSPAKS